MPTGIYKRKLKPLIKIGDRFGRLTAVKFSHKDKWSFQIWLFRCDCGKEKKISVSSVKIGNTKSCGCLNFKPTNSHGMVGTRTYNSWASMKKRCLNKNHIQYKDYGGRGIKICERWMKFKNFYEDMGDRPVDRTLDRIDNDKGYCKENCRWATWKEQANNKRKI